MTPGKIVENYHGRFAKVIRITEDGSTHLSAWVRTPELAEEETAAVIALNEFGLSQVLKGGANTPGATVIAEEAEEEDKQTPAKPLEKWSKAELQAKATELGIPAEGTVAVLVAAITAKLAEEAE